MIRRTTQLALGTALLAGLATFAPAAHADRVGFNISIGGPGYAISAGNAPYWGYAPYYGHPYRYRHWRRAYVAPPVVYAPAPRVVYRAPYVAPRVIVREPSYYYYGPY